MLIELNKYDGKNMLTITDDEICACDPTQIVKDESVTIEVDSYEFFSRSSGETELRLAIKGHLKEFGIEASSIKLR